ncbi:MAG TPA: beta-ketoacyl synthase N-terminal-like domain-containing protein, partial [Solirubrobacterales bacterium]|nr:beta-ketoacyl synthase N-terminal-like domain-containing protein [Solirubrobacterales bacterium]
MVGQTQQELLNGLEALARGAPATNVFSARVKDGGGTVFLFPGQGSQWVGMGLELLDTSVVFRDRMTECANALSPHVRWSLLEVLRADPDDPVWKRAEVVQPVLFAYMVSLSAVWRSFGVNPSAVIGQSLGEIVSACVIGALSLEDGARHVALWGQAQAAIPTQGAMASISMKADDLERRLRPWGGRLEVSAINGPHWCGASGDSDAIQGLLEELSTEGINARKIDVDVAAHSRHVDAVRERLRRDLRSIRAESAHVPFYSSVTGDALDTGTLDAEYWATNLRQPVLLEQAVRAALRDGHRVFIEVSPHPVLTGAVQETGDEVGAMVLGSLRRGQGGKVRLINALAEAHVRGASVDWQGFFERRGAREVGMPLAISSEPGERDAPPPRLSTGNRYPLLRARLDGIPRAEQREMTRDLVRVQVATVLGLADQDAIDVGMSFRDLGVDSALATELVNGLSQASGLKLPATIAFDFPTTRGLADHLRARALEVSEDLAPVVPFRGVDGEPIAIVGIGCRFPGGVRSSRELWDLVATGTDAIDGFPGDRGWDDDPYGSEAGRRFPRHGGFLEDAAEFDPAFFGIGPREALAMDPQQRLLLEGAWEALEDAGIDPGSLRGTSTGVFAGISSQDYGPGLRSSRGDEDAEDVTRHRLTGTLTSVASGRLAYALGLEGPAVTVDTACSSSLVAMHLAAQALRSGECDLALAGGATVMATPGMFVEFSRQGGLAPDGRCKSFGAGADGTGWSEGSGLLLLARLSDAKRSGQRIHA